MCDLDLINITFSHKHVKISKIINFLYDLDLDPMTLIFKLDLDMEKLYLQTKNEVTMRS